MAAPQTLLGAISAYFDANIPGVTGGSWLSQAGEPIPNLPVVVYDVDFERTYYTENGFTEQGTVTFRAWAKGAAAAEDLAQKIHDTFRKESQWQDLAALIGGQYYAAVQVTQMIPEKYTIAAEEIRMPDGAVVYRIEKSFNTVWSGVESI